MQLFSPCLPNSGKFLNPYSSPGMACYAKIVLSDTVGYQLIEGTRCEGTKIYTWATGNSAGYGSGLTFLDSCKQQCSEHPECTGFLESIANGIYGICSYWRAAPLSLSTDPAVNCYIREGVGGALEKATAAQWQNSGRYKAITQPAVGVTLLAA